MSGTFCQEKQKSKINCAARLQLIYYINFSFEMQISRYFWSVKTNTQLFDFRVIWIHKFNKTPGLLSFYRYSYLFNDMQEQPILKFQVNETTVLKV